jgi:hypothetical protein
MLYLLLAACTSAPQLPAVTMVDTGDPPVEEPVPEPAPAPEPTPEPEPAPAPTPDP